MQYSWYLELEVPHGSLARGKVCLLADAVEEEEGHEAHHEGKEGDDAAEDVLQPLHVVHRWLVLDVLLQECITHVSYTLMSGSQYHVTTPH